MTTTAAPRKKSTPFRHQSALEIILDKIRLQATNAAVRGCLNEQGERYAEHESAGWQMTFAVPASGQSVEDGFPKIVFVKGQNRIEIQFPTILTSHCNVICGARQIVIRHNKVVADNGQEFEEHPQPPEAMLQSLFALMPIIRA